MSHWCRVWAEWIALTRPARRVPACRSPRLQSVPVKRNRRPGRRRSRR